MVCLFLFLFFRTMSTFFGWSQTRFFKLLCTRLLDIDYLVDIFTSYLKIEERNEKNIKFRVKPAVVEVELYSTQCLFFKDHISLVSLSVFFFCWISSHFFN